VQLSDQRREWFKLPAIYAAVPSREVNGITSAAEFFAARHREGLPLMPQHR